MEQGEREMFKKALELSEENNKMLHQLRRTQRLGFIFTVLKWSIIIGTTVGFYYLFQPLLDQVLDVYSGFGDVYNGLESSFENIQNSFTSQ